MDDSKDTESYGALNIISHSSELNSKDWRVAKTARKYQVTPAVRRGEMNGRMVRTGDDMSNGYVRSDQGEGLHGSEEA